MPEKVKMDSLRDPRLFRLVLDHRSQIRRLDISSRECREHESLRFTIEPIREVNELAQDLGANEGANEH